MLFRSLSWCFCVDKVYRCQINRQALHLCSVVRCTHLSVCVWNNNLSLFYSLNCFSLEMPFQKYFLLNLVCNFSFCLPLESLTTSGPISGRKQAGCQPDRTNSNLGRETRCDLMIHPEIKAEERKWRTL